jgi:hypothetical protein
MEIIRWCCAVQALLQLSMIRSRGLSEGAGHGAELFPSALSPPPSPTPYSESQIPSRHSVHSGAPRARAVFCRLLEDFRAVRRRRPERRAAVLAVHACNNPVAAACGTRIEPRPSVQLEHHRESQGTQQDSQHDPEPLRPAWNRMLPAHRVDKRGGSKRGKDRHDPNRKAQRRRHLRRKVSEMKSSKSSDPFSRSTGRPSRSRASAFPFTWWTSMIVPSPACR